jgi:hypothetical protein
VLQAISAACLRIYWITLVANKLLGEFLLIVLPDIYFLGTTSYILHPLLIKHFLCKSRTACIIQASNQKKWKVRKQSQLLNTNMSQTPNCKDIHYKTTEVAMWCTKVPVQVMNIFIYHCNKNFTYLQPLCLHCPSCRLWWSLSHWHTARNSGVYFDHLLLEPEYSLAG